MRNLKPLTSSWPFPARSSINVFDDFDKMVDGFFQTNWPENQSFSIACDVNENEKAFMLSFDIPGVEKDKINIELNDKNQLVVSGERRHQSSEEGDNFVRRERSRGHFHRLFSLPQSVDRDKIEAHYENGVLEVILPKSDKARGKSIEIQSGKEGGFFSKLLGDKKETKDVPAS